MEIAADGMTSTYSCATGYSLVGDTTRTCGVDGSGWNGSEATCGNVLREIMIFVRKYSFMDLLYKLKCSRNTESMSLYMYMHAVRLVPVDSFFSHAGLFCMCIG